MVPVWKPIRTLGGSGMNDLTLLSVDDCSIHVLESRKRFEKLRDRKKDQQVRMERVMQGKWIIPLEVSSHLVRQSRLLKLKLQ